MLNLECKLNDFIQVGLPHVWDVWYPNIEIPNIPVNCLFKKEYVDDVLTTQFFMRWYFKAFFDFTFEETNFKKEVKFLWQTWIVNRKNIYEKVIDALAVTTEASLFCSRIKNFEITLMDGQEILHDCLQDLKLEFGTNSGLNKSFEKGTDYSNLTECRKYRYLAFQEYCNPTYTETLLVYIGNSTVLFPIPIEVKTDSAEDAALYTIFVRLHDEMKFYTKLEDTAQNESKKSPRKLRKKGRQTIPKKTSSKIKYMYYPQDVKEPMFLEFDTPVDIMDERAVDITSEFMNICVKNFALNVLKLQEKSLTRTTVHLISERYNNSLKELLRRRYDADVGCYCGDSGEPFRDPPTSHEFTVCRSGPPDEKKKENWIETVHINIGYYLFGETTNTIETERVTKKLKANTVETEKSNLSVTKK